jgi:signal-transduction protein with cAMP-binding, CBS, and nucleotidyltransferase domain
VACGLLDREHGQILCLPESKWKELFMHLADRSTYPDLDTFRVFDLWGTCEEQGLVRNFREYIISTVQGRPGLLDKMRAANHAFTIPDCFYRDKILMSGGQHPQLNLKQHVLTPLVSAVRLLSLERGIGALSTKDRVETLSEMGVVSRERASDLQAIYPWLVEICLKRALDRGESLNWILDPQHCGSEEKRLLTESFRMVKETVGKAS